MVEAQNNQVAVAANGQEDNNDHLVQSTDPEHPANLIPEMCRKFYTWGWVTGTGGGVGVIPLLTLYLAHALNNSLRFFVI